MLGVMASAPILLEGKMLAPAAAKAAGLIDEVVPADELLAKAKAWILSATDADIVKPWDAKGYKIPGGTPYQPAGFMTYLGAAAMVHGKTQGAYPAAKAMLSAIYEGALFPSTPRSASRPAGSPTSSHPSSGAMIRSLFLNKQALEKGAARPALPDQSVKTLGILGAGMMGAGIATVAAQAGIEVVLIHRDQAAADKGRAHVEAFLDEGLKRKRITPEKKAEVLSRVTATPDYAALKGCDLVVEAVFEDPSVKAEATRRAEEHLPADAIFATNTSTLPIGELAKASRSPERFSASTSSRRSRRWRWSRSSVASATGDRAVAKALDFVRQIKKTPIVVNDARFFYANRCIIPYINEGVRMVAEGVEPALIENAAKQLGMPLGPLQLVDETSIDLGMRSPGRPGPPWATPIPRARRTGRSSSSPISAGSGARPRRGSTPMTRPASGRASGRSCADCGRRGPTSRLWSRCSIGWRWSRRWRRCGRWRRGCSRTSARATLAPSSAGASCRGRAGPSPGSTS